MSTGAFLRLILQLKFQLTQRHYRGQIGNLIALIIAAIGMLIFALLGGSALFAWTHNYGAELRDRVFIWALWILSLLWLSAPLSQVDLSRSLDLNALRLFPLSRARLTLAVLADSAFSPLALLLSPLILALMASMTLSLAELPFVILSLLLLFGCLLALTQALVLWANRLLTSRRYADASLLAGFVLLVVVQMLNLSLQNMEDLRLPEWLSLLLVVAGDLVGPLGAWLFPGLSARALAAVSAGNAGEALGLYGMLLAQLGICVLLASVAVSQFYSGELDSGGRAPAKQAARRGRAGRSLPLVPAVAAMFERERAYLSRDPILKLLFISTLFWAVYVLLTLFMLRFSSAREELPAGSMLGRYMVLGIAALMSYAESGVLFNKFGYEGSQFTTTLLSPVPRLSILRAKSLFFLTYFAPVNALLVCLVAFMLKVPSEFTVAALAIVLTNTALVDAIGHFISIYMPFTYRRRGGRLRATMPQPGCGYLVIYMLVFNGAHLLLLPGTLALGLGVAFNGWAGLLPGLVICALELFLAWRFALPWAARLLGEREPQLLEMLSRSAD